MKTIAIFCGYALPHLGGIERYVHNLSIQLVKKGYQVIIVSSNYNHDNLKEEKNGIISLRVPIYKLFSSRYPILKHNKEYKKIIQELDKYKIDRIIVNTRFHLTSVMGAKYGKKRNIPVFLIDHSSSHLSVDNKILDFFGEIYEHALTKYLQRFINENYGVSKEVINWQKHFGIISNGIWYNSINRFDEGVTIKKENKKITFLYAGRILKQKGPEDLIQAFIKLNKEYKNIQLIIAGDGEFLKYLQQQYGNNKNIDFKGKVDFNKLIKLYAKANVFVNPSNYPEGLPTCILEAGLMKCAIITTPNGGTKYFINKNNGIVIEDNSQLEDNMKRLIDNPDERKKYGENIRKTVINNFMWEKTVEKIIKDMQI